MQRKIALALLIAGAALLRLWQLGTPDSLVFDEIYYVDGARDYLAQGVELADGKGEFVVHPPIGKWLIASGIALFGDNPVGWRIAAALFGTLAIVLIFLIAHRLFASFNLALLAGGLTALDGLHLVMSRTALLDIFLTFFLLAALLALLYQRHELAALAIGLALGTKWSALYAIVAIGIYLLIWRRGVIWRYLVIVPITYTLSWSGWFLSGAGWSRDYSTNPLASWIHYHREILNFHTGLKTDHPYEASPWNWLVLGRPTSFFYESPKSCGAANCSQEILALGTPIIWWFGLIAIAITVGYCISRRDRRAAIILAGLAANYLPWLFFPERTTFYFYAVALQPFLILAICYSIHIYLERPETRPRRRQVVAVGVAISAAAFAYFLPIYIGSVLTYEQWSARMWLPSWI